MTISHYRPLPSLNICKERIATNIWKRESIIFKRKSKLRYIAYMAHFNLGVVALWKRDWRLENLMVRALVYERQNCGFEACSSRIQICAYMYIYIIYIYMLIFTYIILCVYIIYMQYIYTIYIYIYCTHLYMKSSFPKRAKRHYIKWFSNVNPKFLDGFLEKSYSHIYMTIFAYLWKGHSQNRITELGIDIWKPFKEMALNAFWKRVFHIQMLQSRAQWRNEGHIIVMIPLKW